jgi:iron complex outermembrane receptor protein
MLGFATGRTGASHWCVAACFSLFTASVAVAQTPSPAAQNVQPQTSQGQAAADQTTNPAQSAAAVQTPPPAQSATDQQTTAGQAAAGTTQQQAEPQLPKVAINVTVTAPRVEIPLKDSPAATSVVTQDALQAMPRTIAADEALMLVPGVKIDNQADGERVHLSIRGQGLLTERGIRGITVLLDGLPLNDPTGFVPDLFDVDWASVQRIEVLRGPSSALYGGSGSGGVINITTRDGDAGTISGQAALTGGSYGFFKPYAEAGGTSGDVNYHFTASANSGDGYRVHTAFDAYNVYGKVKYAAGDKTRLTFIVAGTHYYNDNAEGLNLTWLAEDRRQANPDALTYNEGQHTDRLTAGMSGQTDLGNGRDVTYAVWDRRTVWLESVPSSVQHRDYNSPGATVQYNMATRLGSFTNHLSVGADFSRQTITEYRTENMGNAVEGTSRLTDQLITQNGVAAFLIDRVEFSPQWSGTAGLRLDHITNDLVDNLKLDDVDMSGSADFSKVTGRLGVTYTPLPDLGLYASWGQGFLPPATEELANNPDAQGGFNTHLVPATSQGEEVGVRGGTRGLSYDVAFFHLVTDNDFGRYRVPGRPLETFYGNLGHSRRYGLETEVTYSPTPAATVRAAYTFNDFLYTTIDSMFGSFTDKVMPNAPRHQFAFDGQYVLADRLILGLGVFAQTGWYVDQTNVATCSGYTLVNPRVSYRLGKAPYRAELTLQVRNLFSTEYIAFSEPDPDGNSYQPGPTREIFVGVRVHLGR